MRKKYFSKRQPVFDGVRNLYAVKGPLFRTEFVTDAFKLRTESGEEKQFRVTIRRVAQNRELTIGNLNRYIQERSCSMYREVVIFGNIADGL